MLATVSGITIWRKEKVLLLSRNQAETHEHRRSHDEFLAVRFLDLINVYLFNASLCMFRSLSVMVQAA